MIPSDRCRNVVNKGVVVIPNGHPLSAFVNDPEYSSVLSEYLGTTSSYAVCTYHQYSDNGYSNYDPTVQNVLIPDAQQLIESAYSMMAVMDPSSDLYNNIQRAINNLNAILPLPAALILIIISVGLTLFSGLIPSRSAAKKDPVVALRTE